MENCKPRQVGMTDSCCRSPYEVTKNATSSIWFRHYLQPRTKHAYALRTYLSATFHCGTPSSIDSSRRSSRAVGFRTRGWKLIPKYGSFWASAVVHGRDGPFFLTSPASASADSFVAKVQRPGNVFNGPKLPTTGSFWRY